METILNFLKSSGGITLIVLMVAIFGMILVSVFGGKLKFKHGDNEINFGKNPNENIMNMTIAIISEENILSERIYNTKQKCLDEQLNFARTRLNSIKNDIIEKYRDEEKENKSGVQIFSLLFDRDYDTLISSVFDVIRRNHLAAKTDIEFREYLRVTAVNEIGILKRKCKEYYEPVNSELSFKIMEQCNDIVFRGIEYSIENARNESEKKDENILKEKSASMITKKGIIKRYFPELKDEDIESKLVVFSKS